MIATENFGTSLLGEVWYAEAESPTGPWVWTREDRHARRVQLLQSRSSIPISTKKAAVDLLRRHLHAHVLRQPRATPRYDYNQIMYKLDLADPRMNLPSVVVGGEEGGSSFLALDRAVWSIRCGSLAGRMGNASCKRGPGRRRQGDEAFVLCTGRRHGEADRRQRCRYTNMWEREGERRVYSTEADLKKEGYSRSEKARAGVVLARNRGETVRIATRGDSSRFRFRYTVEYFGGYRSEYPPSE